MLEIIKTTKSKNPKDALCTFLKDFCTYFGRLPLNSINENEASEIRFEMYELIGILSVWDIEKLKQSEPINRYIKGGKGLLMDEQKECISVCGECKKINHKNL